ncbi:hypothetical protein RCC89_19790 [Cytophagaceae bacterium ABcell3]|nr:hypothetical protein RCC89_19790 [Cytophagaceae bacterium ABcell3]
MNKLEKLKAILTGKQKPMEIVGKSVDIYAKEILKYTPQLYTKLSNETENIIPQAEASGILIEVKNTRFLITAGHFLVSNTPDDIGIMIEDMFYVLNGIVKYVNPSESEDADKTDIAVWKLEDDVANALSSKYSFLQYEDIDFNHIVSSESKYLIVGFPWRNTVEKKETKKLIVSPFVFLTKASAKNFYKNLNFDQHSNILLDYRQMKVKNFGNGMVQANKSPEGVSGCGVWYLPTFLINGTPKPKLVGQIIEQNKLNSILISTRIHLVLEVLRTEFEIDIPASSITRLKNE